MEGLFSLLMFAGLFYFMMRFGCGAHMVHGGHGSHGSGKESEKSHGGRATSARDPICGMAVTPETGYGRMYEGREYRFCSRKCLDQFETDPARYTK